MQFQKCFINQVNIFLFLFYFVVKNPEKIYSFGKVKKFEDSQSFREIKYLKEIKIFLKKMSAKSSISKFQRQAERFEQAAKEARHKAAEDAEHKERKQAEKEAKEQKKRDEKSCKRSRNKSKDDDDIPKSGATNTTFYPVHQQVMS